MNLIKIILLRLRGEVSTSKLISMGLKVGKNFKRQSGCRIDYSHCWLIEIGDNVTLAPNVHILAHDASTKMHIGYTRIGQVKIGNSVFIGANSIILPNVIIGDNVIIGAGSIINKDIPNGVIVAGNPCKIIGNIKDFITRHNENLNSKPIFDKEYTLRGNISPEKKEKMKNSLQEDYGYVI